MTGLRTMTVDEVVRQASRDVGILWPLDRAVASNPLVDRMDSSFDEAVSVLGNRLGLDLWPDEGHLDELVRRELALPLAPPPAGGPKVRPATLLGRTSAPSPSQLERARVALGALLLEVTAADLGRVASASERASELLASRASWVRLPRRVRDRMADRLARGRDADLLVATSTWSEAGIIEELARHLARLPGWAAWAKWNTYWARRPHPNGITLAELLELSLALDLAWVDEVGEAMPSEPEVGPTPDIDVAGRARLERLEVAIHGEILSALPPRAVGVRARPAIQVITCIDVRSEPLRRALEADPSVETVGFAGFFGLLAMARPRGEQEDYEAFPVIAGEAARIEGGVAPSAVDDGVVAAGGTLAELTHEPTAMFALAEVGGFLAAPWLLARSLVPGWAFSEDRQLSDWRLTEGDVVGIAEGALRGMGLTESFAPEVVVLGHGASSANNAHLAALECGACAGHAGAPNAAALAEILNDHDLRVALRARGIDIPDDTVFRSGEHDTTRERVRLHGGGSPHLMGALEHATAEVAAWRTGRARGSRRLLDRRAGDWAEVRPEWGLAGHGAIIIAPRASTRRADLGGRAFLHSYEPAADADGATLRALLTAPMVVAQWINAAYYFSTVAGGTLGAGDKTLLNPVGDFAVIQGDDPDLRMGLPSQSITDGARFVHLPVRLLVAIESPLERIEAVLGQAPVAESLVHGGWVRLVARSGPEAPWVRWEPGEGWTPW